MAAAIGHPLYLLAVVLDQVPATPTPRPAPPPAPINIPSTNIWQFASEAVGWWNQVGGDRTQIVQILIIALIVFVSIVILVNSVRGSGSESEVKKE